MARPKKPRKIEWKSFGETVDLEGTHLSEPGDEGIFEAERAEDYARKGMCDVLGPVDDPRDPEPEKGHESDEQDDPSGGEEG